MAIEWASRVRVNAISPGPILWPEGDVEFTHDEKQRVLESTCLQKLGGAESIVHAAIYLLEAQFVTGQNLCVDGGKSLHPDTQP